MNGNSVPLNSPGHVTLVMYTNPDLESTARKVTLALDADRGHSNFMFVRVVDLRGGVPPSMRGIVRNSIRKEQIKEAARLKKAGISSANPAPIIPDFGGTTLGALGWDSTYDEVHVIIYDRKGHEVKRMESAGDPSEVKRALAVLL